MHNVRSCQMATTSALLRSGTQFDINDEPRISKLSLSRFLLLQCSNSVDFAVLSNLSSRTKMFALKRNKSFSSWFYYTLLLYASLPSGQGFDIDKSCDIDKFHWLHGPAGAAREAIRIVQYAANAETLASSPSYATIETLIGKESDPHFTSK
jgi:hypothetical protein